ncbi:28S ribosomal protein S28, mitochondrial [Ooceraea biroi]|uniref:28S ribosomal protein S28, mitochondrial n=1 Tax=Ooceraea biroi TaxID=2015173 RepID=A0A026X192_OOCBI|nr:28S ribosomal protein S28, mitochondrial [Ooceraea biroi]
MNKIRHLERVFTHLRSLNVLRMNVASAKRFSTDKNSDGESKGSSTSEFPEVETRNVENTGESESDLKLSGFARSYEKFTHIDDPKEPERPQTFASLVRNSKFVDLGDPEGKIVIGKVFHVVGDDLYIDFGWKFHCVCRKPVKKGQYYVRGAKVRLMIKDLELSSKFLGATTDITLLEADCTLMGLVWSPAEKLQMPAERTTTRSAKLDTRDQPLSI